MISVLLNKLDKLLTTITSVSATANKKVVQLFTSNGIIFIPSGVNSIDFLLIGAGGGGGSGQSGYGGGGGARGNIVYRKSFPFRTSISSLEIIIGQGGLGGQVGFSSTAGTASIINFRDSSNTIIYTATTSTAIGGSQSGAFIDPTSIINLAKYSEWSGYMSNFNTSAPTPGNIPNGVAGDSCPLFYGIGGSGGLIGSPNGGNGGIGSGGGGAFSSTGNGGNGGNGLCYIAWTNQ